MSEDSSDSGQKPPQKPAEKPKYELQKYRDFIREAGPYVSLIIGRRLKAADAALLTDAEIAKIALLIDSRVGDLNKSKGE
jgi:hypothetical protein